MRLASVGNLTNNVLEFALMNSDIDQILAKFSAGFKELNYRKGDIVIRGDDDPTGVYLIKSGTVKMSSIDEDGTEMAVNIYKTGTYFPMTWAIGEIGNIYNYQTLSASKLVRIPKDEFTAFLKANPEVLYDLTRRILIGLDGTLFNMRHLLSGDSTSKIAVILYMLARRFGVKDGSQIEIGLALTHQDISHFAGLTRETTTLGINKLVKSGIIVQKQRKLIVKDMDSLRDSF